MAEGSQVAVLGFLSLFFAAAGNYNNGTLNNAGDNGNYWSSTPNDSNNAYNLNFNSGNINTNNNNRNNGYSVRPVSAFTVSQSRPFSTTPEQLLLDLFRAYKDARRHKRSKKDQLRFERYYERNLIRLRDAIFSRHYKPGPCKCFIIHDPKMREILAAMFRDRVVHHLLYNYIYRFMEAQFIRDSYSCIKGRGTHDGIFRLEEMIREVSSNFSRPCYVLKLDVEGYFMHINRGKLLALCKEMLLPYRDKIDYPLVEYLLDSVVCNNPLKGCIRVSPPWEWNGLPAKKSLFQSPPGKGMPIGNLTSQLFSNVYMNRFDHFMHTLSGGLYGRYVDDAFVVSGSKAFLRRIIPQASCLLKEQLGLDLNMDKVAVFSAYRGVEFHGAYLKPFRRYVSSPCLRRMNHRVWRLSGSTPLDVSNSVNSYLGITSHFSAYNIRKEWKDGPLAFSFLYGYYRNGVLSYRLYRPYKLHVTNKLLSYTRIGQRSDALVAK